MPAVHHLPTARTPPVSHCDPAALALLNRIRFLAAACRVSARLDLHEACLRHDVRAERSEEAHLVTLIRVMGQALGTRPVFRRPGERDLSFDEAWLVSTIAARMAGDDASFAFLLTRRVEASRRRGFGMLVAGLADRLGDSTSVPYPSENLDERPSQAGISC